MSTFTNHTIKMFSMLVIASAGILGGMMGQAQAGDKKIYNAALCTPSEGSQESISYKHKNGAIYNYDTKRDLDIFCPVTRDNTTNRNGLKAWGFVGRNVPNSQDRLKCRMMSNKHENGFRIKKVPEKWVSLPLDRGSRSHTGTTKEPRVSSGVSGSFYTLHCVIPKAVPGKTPSYLASYYADEN